MRVWPLVLLGLSWAGAAFASGAAGSQDALAWLKKMAGASRQLNYTGTFVYQHGNQVETSRIVHFVNAAGGEFERLETLDGPAREVIRTNEQVTCYLPNSRTVLIEQRNARFQLPVLLPERLPAIIENYSVRTTHTDRVAGYECQVIVLEPKDNLRYGRSFCAEVNSGLPLRVRTINDKKQSLESFAFTQLTIGGSFNRDLVRSKYAAKAQSQNWRIDRSGLNIAGDTSADAGWVIGSQPPGFKKLADMRRSIAGKAGSVSHIVLSDGLAAISIFIEPLSKALPSQPLSHQGAVHIYTRPHGGHMITVLGEAPAATVMQIANSLELKTATAAR
jgi:sigma-E factor negative regulatory protein RseB